MKYYRRVLFYMLSRSYRRPHALIETREQLMRVLRAVYKNTRAKEPARIFVEKRKRQMRKQKGKAQ